MNSFSNSYQTNTSGKHNFHNFINGWPCFSIVNSCSSFFRTSVAITQQLLYCSFSHSGCTNNSRSVALYLHPMLFLPVIIPRPCFLPGKRHGVPFSLLPATTLPEGGGVGGEMLCPVLSLTYYM